MTDTPTANSTGGAVPAGTYLYEFLYRGSSAASDGAPAYHVILAVDAKDVFGRATTTVSQALTPEQAKAAGFDLPEIVAAINAATMAQVASLQAELITAQARIAALQTNVAASAGASTP